MKTSKNNPIGLNIRSDSPTYVCTKLSCGFKTIIPDNYKNLCPYHKDPLMTKKKYDETLQVSKEYIKTLDKQEKKDE